MQSMGPATGAAKTTGEASYLGINARKVFAISKSDLGRKVAQNRGKTGVAEIKHSQPLLLQCL